jgi:hypothetical protein
MSDVRDWLWDDDAFQAALREALAETVPREFVEAGKASFTWHSIDIELAALTYDSAALTSGTSTRADAAPVRALTFASPEMTIDVEVTPDAVFGQVAPPRSGSVTVCFAHRQVSQVDVDDAGYFVIRPVPVEPFRLLCRTAGGADVLTGWVSPGSD